MRITAGCPRPNLFQDCAVRLVIHVPVAMAVNVAAGPGSILNAQASSGPACGLPRRRDHGMARALTG